MKDGTPTAAAPRIDVPVAITAARVLRLLEVPAALAVVVALWQVVSVAVGNTKGGLFGSVGGM